MHASVCVLSRLCVRRMGDNNASVCVSSPFHWDRPCCCCTPSTPTPPKALRKRHVEYEDDGFCRARAAEHGSTAHIQGIICSGRLSSGTNGIMITRKMWESCANALTWLSCTAHCLLYYEGNPVFHVQFKGKSGLDVACAVHCSNDMVFLIVNTVFDQWMYTELQESAIQWSVFPLFSSFPWVFGKLAY